MSLVQKEAKINKYNHIKLQSFCAVKETITEYNSPHIQKQIHPVLLWHWLIPKIDKAFNKTITINPIKIWEEEMNRNILKYDMQMVKWYMKMTLSQWWSEKCKSKIQCGTHQKGQWQPVLRRIWGKGLLSHYWWESQLIQSFWKAISFGYLSNKN